jgi:hypothetical protein
MTTLENDGTGLPQPPDLTGKTESQQAALMSDYTKLKDRYFEELLSRPSGQSMSACEKQSLASEVLRVLRESGHRI